MSRLLPTSAPLAVAWTQLNSIKTISVAVNIFSPVAGEVNNAYVTDVASVAGSRKSLALQPVLIMRPHAPDTDAYSHYSGRTARSKHSMYANTMHNYQL